MEEIQDAASMSVVRQQKKGNRMSLVGTPPRDGITLVQNSTEPVTMDLVGSPAIEAALRSNINPAIPTSPSEPQLVIVNPYIGEALLSGDTAIVAWLTTTPISSIDIRLSDGSLIGTHVPTTGGSYGSYEWIVSAPPGNGYTVMTSAQTDNGTFMASSGIFHIVAAPALSSLYASAGDHVQIGKETISTWETIGDVLEVSIELLDLHASTVYKWPHTPNLGTFPWVVPVGVPPGYYTMQVASTSFALPGVTVSSGIFKIEAATDNQHHHLHFPGCYRPPFFEWKLDISGMGGRHSSKYKMELIDLI